MNKQEAQALLDAYDDLPPLAGAFYQPDESDYLGYWADWAAVQVEGEDLFGPHLPDLDTIGHLTEICRLAGCTDEFFEGEEGDIPEFVYIWAATDIFVHSFLGTLSRERELEAMREGAPQCHNCGHIATQTIADMPTCWRYDCVHHAERVVELRTLTGNVSTLQARRLIESYQNGSPAWADYWYKWIARQVEVFGREVSDVFKDTPAEQHLDQLIGLSGLSSEFYDEENNEGERYTDIYLSVGNICEFYLTGGQAAQ